MTPANAKVLESLNFGISAEIKSYVFYIEAAKLVKSPELGKALLKLAGEEKEHYQVLERQHHALVTSEQWVSYNDILKQKGLPEINESMADTHRILLEEVRQAKTEKAILDIGLGLEREAYRIYSQTAGKASDPKEKETYEYLARFEQGHVKLIQSMIAAL